MVVDGRGFGFAKKKNLFYFQKLNFQKGTLNAFH